jgi:acyl carrier protein phosphodiesterase
MNWLAHLYLSEPSAEFRIGNLLPDLLRPRDLRGLPVQFIRGAERHRQIDAFTDSHEVVRRSIQRLSSPYRRYGGILMDIFYDHFLSVDWDRFSEIPLHDFIRQFYDSIDAHQQAIPSEAFMPLKLMSLEDWLGQYRELSGIRHTLARVERRMSRPVDFANSVLELRDQYTELHRDFDEFFPELMEHCHMQSAKHDGSSQQY